MTQQAYSTKSSVLTKWFKKKSGFHRVVKKQTFYSICLLGFVVLVGFYYLVFQNYQKKTRQLEESNKILEANVESWRTYHQNQPKYQSANEEMQAAIEEAIAVYPCDVKEEDILMLAVDLQESCGVSISNINLSEEQSVYSIDASTVLGTQLEGLEDTIECKKKRVSFVLSGNYTQIKDAIARIYQQKNKVSIENITLSKSGSDGQLVGNMDLCMYVMTGTGKEYQTPDIAPYTQGTLNIFGVEERNGETSEEVEEQ